jgi:hypothetical protein
MVPAPYSGSSNFLFIFESSNRRGIRSSCLVPVCESTIHPSM